MIGAYYAWGEPSPKLRAARLLIISDDQREIMRTFDMAQYAKIILNHFSKRSRPSIDELKLALMLVILIKYSGVRPKYAAGSESFVSPHFLAFALQNVPEGMGRAGEELLAELTKGAKKRGLFKQGPGYEPMLWSELLRPPS